MSDILNNPLSPDIYADQATGYLTINGNLRITLCSMRSGYSKESAKLERVVVDRLVVPVAAAEQMAQVILAAVKQAKAALAEPTNRTVQ